MLESTIWWLLAGAAIAVELVTATFYLLMLAVGLVAGAVAAHFGVPLMGQMVIAALIGGGSVAAWHLYRSKKPSPLSASANRDVHLDIGEQVHVSHWNADGTASVRFRGAQWTAVSAHPQEPSVSGNFKIKEMMGNRLVIERL